MEEFQRSVEPEVAPLVDEPLAGSPHKSARLAEKCLYDFLRWLGESGQTFTVNDVVDHMADEGQARRVAWVRNHWGDYVTSIQGSGRYFSAIPPSSETHQRVSNKSDPRRLNVEVSMFID